MTEHPDIFAARYRKALQELEAAPLHRANYDPPMMRLVRWAGLRVRPPHYRGAAANALLFGGAFAVLWGLIMWVLLGAFMGMPGSVIAVVALMAGAGYGAWMAQGIRRDAAAAGLSDWRALEPDGAAG